MHLFACLRPRRNSNFSTHETPEARAVTQPAISSSAGFAGGDGGGSGGGSPTVRLAGAGQRAPERVAREIREAFDVEGRGREAFAIQQTALADWAKSNRATFSPKLLDDLAPFKLEGGQEHEVFLTPRAEDGARRVVKVTHDGLYGQMRDTPMDYLDRMERVARLAA